jgi:hypothetical protein
VHRITAWLFLVWLLFPASALAYCPPEAVCVDAAMIKTHVALARMTLDGGKEATREGYGLTLGYGTGLASALIGRREGFAGHDDVWLDLTIGGRSSDRLAYYTLKEGVFAVSMDTGYVLLLGWHTKTWGLFGGTGVRYVTTIIGGSMDFERSKPYMPVAVRAQYRTGKLLWKAYASVNTRFTRPSVRVDLPLGENFWITAAWTRTDQDVSVFSDDNGVFSGHSGSLTTVGIRSSLMD